MEILKKNFTQRHGGTEDGAKFGRRAGCCVALALILVFGAMFISCTDPEDIIPNADNAEQPIITAQPADVFWNVYNNTNPIDLTVTANVTDGGTLTYQWYSNTSKSASGGTAITTGGTDETLSLIKSNYTTNGSRYFYVVVTNTNNLGGNKTATTTSVVAEVAVVGYPDSAYTTSAMPEELKGTWTYDWGGGYIEKYIINETTFTSEYTYAGTIAGHRSNNDGDGYITIKFTENFGYVDSENMFYVIHYKDLSISEITLAGAWLGADPDFEYGVGSGGKATQAEAEAVMTVSAGYFGMYSTLSKDGAGNSETLYITADIPQALKGIWKSPYGETITISAAEFNYDMDFYGFTSNYAGTVINHRVNGDKGYITIQYTSNSSDATATGKYYVIHYKNLTTLTVSVAGAAPGYDMNDPDFADGKGGGKETQAEAETAYTVTGGYFGMYSDCNLYIPNEETFSNDLEGEWEDEDENIITITDSTISVSMMGMFDIFVGDIVKLVDNGNGSGYFVFKYITIFQDMASQDLMNTYTVLYWKNYDDDTVDFAIGGSDDLMTFEEGEASIEDAETEYINSNGSFTSESDLITFEKI